MTLELPLFIKWASMEKFIMLFGCVGSEKF
jgi:hypothetical protein